MWLLLGNKDPLTFRLPTLDRSTNDLVNASSVFSELPPGKAGPWSRLSELSGDGVALLPAAPHHAPLTPPEGKPRVNCVQHFCHFKLSDDHQRTRCGFEERRLTVAWRRAGDWLVFPIC